MGKLIINWDITGLDGTTFDTSRDMELAAVPMPGMKIFTETAAGSLPVVDVTFHPDGDIYVQLQEYQLADKAAVDAFVGGLGEYGWT